jgi:hypothetical protein
VTKMHREGCWSSFAGRLGCWSFSDGNAIAGSLHEEANPRAAETFPPIRITDTTRQISSVVNFSKTPSDAMIRWL